MNIGEMQRKLSLWAEQDAGRKFYDLHGLVCREDWLRLAWDYVGQNAGNKTAGGDGVARSAFEADREGNLARLRTALQTASFVAHPVRRVGQEDIGLVRSHHPSKRCGIGGVGTEQAVLAQHPQQQASG